jgi:Tfp pilus assembly protein FimT
VILPRKGATLVELLASLAVLAAVLAIVPTSVRRVAVSPTPTDVRSLLLRARESALKAGAPVTLTVIDGVGVHAVTVSEEGFVISDSTLHLSHFLDSSRAPLRLPYGR